MTARAFGRSSALAALCSTRPMAMKVVDDQRVRVDFAVVPKMRVIWWEVAVVVLHDLWVICGPKDHRADEAEGSESTH